MDRILKRLKTAPRRLGVFVINFYQKHISKHLGKKCIYYPSCSEYTKQAIDKYGIIKGSLKGIKRVLKCHPFNQGGIDHLE
ncbi:MAG: membrane protein insertion efficiency factor YidD [Clostridia bacterium]|nr:membrane protein insertion efficiency factor YidD [Clostridia bacterium]